MNPRKVSLSSILVLMMICASSSPAIAQQSGFQYNGIVHVSWWFDEYDGGQAGPSRQALRDTGANWMGLLVTWYQQDASSTAIARNPDPNKDHSDARIRAAIQDAHARGLDVMLKPHVDALNGAWRGDFNPSNVDTWFQSYTQFIVHYATIAQQEGVEGFVIGTELRNLSGAANRNRWLAVITAIRNVYSGTLTYAANATFPADEFTSVSFWDQVDLIGLDGYFSLTNQNNPTVQQLIAAWTNNRNGENSVAAVQNFANSRGKPVIFTEIGYKSTDRANVEPWNFGLSGAIDNQEQRDCYEAAFTVWSQQNAWMRGFFWWAWPVPPPPANDGDYNPRGKPAEVVLRTWQSGTVTPNFTLSLANTNLSLDRGASAQLTVNLARTSFTDPVDLSLSTLPSGVTATFSADPASGNSSTLTFTASGNAALGQAPPITITGVAGALTRTAALTLTVNNPSANVTVTPLVATSSPWYNDQQIRIDNTVDLSALSITVVIQRTTGVSFNGQYNTVGSNIQQSNSGNTNASTITYHFDLSSGTLRAGTGKIFAAQTGGTGTAHATGGDTYLVTYTAGSSSRTVSGTF